MTEKKEQPVNEIREEAELDEEELEKVSGGMKRVHTYIAPRQTHVKYDGSITKPRN